MKFSLRFFPAALALVAGVTFAAPKKPLSLGKLSTDIKSIAVDKSVKWDYDIVYVRAPRFGDEKKARWAEVFNPLNVDPGVDLVLLHPDGSEEVLAEGGTGAVVDPYVSFDGKWVYYAFFHDQRKQAAW